MDPIRVIKGTMCPLPISNVDTDSVTPARLTKMTVKDKEKLAIALFHDWRFNSDGSPKSDFPLNKPEYKNATILLAGDNFGCGSSREHAPWAVLAYGFKAVISTSIADIFKNNSLKNGLIPVVIGEASHKQLFELVKKDPKTMVTIDLEKQQVSWANGSASFPIDPFSKRCLTLGLDEVGYILSFEKKTAEFEKNHLPPVTSYRK